MVGTKSKFWRSGPPLDSIPGLYDGCGCKPPWISGIVVVQKESKTLCGGENLVVLETDWVDGSQTAKEKILKAPRGLKALRKELSPAAPI